MSKRAEQRALEAYPVSMVRRRYDGVPSNDDPYDSNLHDRYCFQRGYEFAEIDLGWHSVDESLPPVDEEVIVLTDYLGLGRFHKIEFGHIVNQETTTDIDGKPYKPISHNGWNIPGVDYWMPVPKLKEEE